MMLLEATPISRFTSHKMQPNIASISVRAGRKIAILGATIMFPITGRKYSPYHGPHVFFKQGEMAPVDGNRKTCSFFIELGRGEERSCLYCSFLDTGRTEWRSSVSTHRVLACPYQTMIGRCFWTKLTVTQGVILPT